MIAGVSDEDIVYDYAISREFNMERLEAFLREHPDTDREIVFANEKSMYGFLEMLRKKHNTVEQYLLDLGITGKETQLLRNKLMEDE